MNSDQILFLYFFGAIFVIVLITAPIWSIEKQLTRILEELRKLGRGAQ